MPAYCHKQEDILQFMQQAHHLDQTDKRKLAFLYHHSGIDTRYSVLSDFSLPEDQWSFLSPLNGNGDDSLISIDDRLAVYKKEALPLSLQAIEKCIGGIIPASGITHLITVSCTGMSAPGLDLEIIEALELSPSIFRTSVNFMGCYGAVHAMKLGKMICDTDANAHVLIVSTELCTLHFQQHYTPDNAAAALLFSDGSAAVLMGNVKDQQRVLSVDTFCSNVTFRGKQEMAWGISSKGFLMTLSGYVPYLIEEDISGLVQEALNKCGIPQQEITHWAIHPGGRKILDTIQQQLHLDENELTHARNVLQRYGNMSSPTILFVLKDIMDQLKQGASPGRVFGVAFGPGLTMETFIASVK